MKKKLANLLYKTLSHLIQEQQIDLEALPQVEVEKPASRAHGDFSTNLALVLASRLKRKPREIAELLTRSLQDPHHLVSKVEVAGPGFINFTLAPQAYHQELTHLLEKQATYGQIALGKGKKVLIEYVSANPTGPMHVGHGRGAVVGDVLARILSKCGFHVHKEFYVNDHGVQIQTLGRSALYYLKKLQSPQSEIPAPPEGAYQGVYLEELVRRYRAQLEAFGEDVIAIGKALGRDLLEAIKDDLAAIQIEFDHFFLESSLYESGVILKTLQEAKARGYLFEEEGATWFRTTAFGDDKDRVLIKKEGGYTYFTPDIAYHQNKFERRFDEYINIWGADHGGYVPRIKAAIEALGHNPDQLKVILIQMVNLKRGNERVQMSKRSGTYVTLREIIEEVGSDATRFFFIQRSADSQLDFDLELAKQQTLDNPVYYIQYAHARIANIFKKAKETFPAHSPSTKHLELLVLPEELELIHALTEYPEILEKCASLLEPHHLCFYLLDLARKFQSYYSKAKQDSRYRVVSEDAALSSAKLALLKAIQIVLQNGLGLLAVEAPEWMGQEE